MRNITISILLLASVSVYAQLVNKPAAPNNTRTITSPKTTYMRCTNMQEHEQWLEKKDPTRKAKREAAIKMINDYIENQKLNRTENIETEYNIPVVVHVVWNTAAEKISTGQVKSQIKVLNQDYNRLNADTTKTPAAFKPYASSMHVTFCLAQTDPNGKATTGIIYTQTSTTSFSTNDYVKFTSKGGDNQWDPTRYLNIWVCNLGGGLLGYGEFPTSPLSNTYGVVILYDAFGDSGTLVPTYNLGRTCSHEIGHCFNLYHTWGDDGGLCPNNGGSDDGVADTPPEGNSLNDGYGNGSGPTFGCPPFPYNENCSSTGNGIMYDDYLDYTDDNCMNIFTKGQASVAAAALAGPIKSLTTSTACNPNGIEQYLLNSSVNIYPNPSAGKFNVSISLVNFNHINVQVINVLGQTVYSWNSDNIPNSNYDLDLSNQPNGLYFVKISDGTNSVVKKIMVNR